MPVVRRSSCGLQRQASPPFHTRAARCYACCLCGGDAAIELFGCASRAGLIPAGPYPSKEHCAGEKPLSSGARPWCDVPAATSIGRPAPRATRSARACARYLLGGGASLEHAARACRVALVVVNRANEKSTSPARGLRPSARARGATCQLRPPTADQRRVPHAAHTLALAVSGEEVHHSSLLRARAVPSWFWSTVPMNRALLQREASVHRRAPVVRRASCGLQR